MSYTMNDRTPFPAFRYPTKGVVVCYERPVSAPQTLGIYYYAPSGDFTPQDIYEVYQTMEGAGGVSGGGVRWPLPGKEHDTSKGRLSQVDRESALALGYNPLCLVAGSGWVLWGNHVVFDETEDSLHIPYLMDIPYLMVWDSLIRHLMNLLRNLEGTPDDALRRGYFDHSLYEWCNWATASRCAVVDFHTTSRLGSWVVALDIRVGSYSRRSFVNCNEPLPLAPLRHFYDYEEPSSDLEPKPESPTFAKVSTEWKGSPDYCIGDVWPKGEVQEKLLAFDSEAPLFPVGQNYENHASRPLKCAKCGNTEFRVAQGHAYTAISCARCNWFCGIHSG